MPVIDILGGKQKLRKERSLLLKRRHPDPTTHSEIMVWREETMGVLIPVPQQRLGSRPGQDSFYLAFA